MASVPRPAPPARFDSRAFRQIMGRFPTGVTIVATRDAQGAPVGVTVNSFTSVSLDPPLVLFCLARHARCYPAFEASSRFAVNMLGGKQRDFSDRFAASPFDWTDIRTEAWETGAPIVSDAAAALDCRVAARYQGGDHEIIVGEVVALGSLKPGKPLVYYRGTFVDLPDLD